MWESHDGSIYGDVGATLLPASEAQGSYFCKVRLLTLNNLKVSFSFQLMKILFELLLSTH